MTQEPFKSALTLGELGETSLALPSDGDSRSGQRRVLEQVSSMRRTNSKYSRGSARTLSTTNGGSRSGQPRVMEQVSSMRRTKSAYNSKGSAGTLSPTSPKSDSVFYEGKFPSSKGNGSDFMYESTMANGHSKSRKQNYSVMQRSISTRSSKYHNDNMLPNIPALCQPTAQADINATKMSIKCNTTHLSQKYRQTKKLDRSQSQPPLNSSLQIIGNSNFQGTSNQFYSSNSTTKRPASARSNSEPTRSVASRSKSELNGINGEAYMSDITLSDAISMISQGDERFQLHGASVIQHNTYTDDNAKEEMRVLNGIPPLVSLLNSANPQIRMTAASALRNLVFKNLANKEEVLRAGVLTNAVQLLQDSCSPETHKHVTGLLWNLSSEERIQPELLRQCLPVLNEKVLQPNTKFSEIGSDIEPRIESFCNATGCLRNLSSGKLANRQALRDCDGLIDSLTTHVLFCVESSSLDDKSVENCVCVLHNLTYQLETEAPTLYKKFSARSPTSKKQADTADTGPIGCFSSQSRKIQQESNSEFPLMDDFEAKGKSLLTHSSTLQSYLALLGDSQNTTTQEACCGALHNLTAKKGIASDVLSHTIIQKLKGLPSITQHLESSNLPLRNSIITLIGNLSRTPQLHRHLARQVLPGVLKSLKSDVSPEADSTIAVACHTANNLLRAEPELGKKVLNNDLINSLNSISENIALPKASKAAGALLQCLWNDKTLQSSLKKQGMNKSSFVNETTSAALRSLQIIE